MEISLKLFFVILQFFNCGFKAATADELDSEKSNLQFKIERVETDLILFRTGASIDFSYNETSKSTGDLVSSPGCPKSYEGRPWIYYGSPSRCYLVGFHGPCPFGKRLFFAPNSKYGVCNCDCFTQEASRHVENPTHSSSSIIDYNQNDISQNLIFLPRRRRVRDHLQTDLSSSSSNNYARMIWNPYAFLRFPERKCNTSEIMTEIPSTTMDDINTEITSYFLNKPAVPPAAEKKDRYSFCFSSWYKRQVVYDNLRQECTPFLDQGPCQNGEWLIRDLDRENGVTCEKRKCPEIKGINVKPEFGGSYSYFDYRRQQCFTEVFGNLEESFFANAGSLIPRSNSRFCRDAGMKYSSRLKTCVKDVSRQFEYKVIG